MKIYHLPALDNELTEFQETARQFSINGFQFWEQISAENSEELFSIDQQWHIDRYSFPLSNAEIICYRTHLKAWRKFAIDQLPWCLILEEGVPADFNFAEILTSIEEINESDPDWDVFFPFNKLKKNNREAEFLKGNSNKESRTNIHESHEVQPYILGLHWGTPIYLLSDRGVKKLDQLVRVRQRFDDEMIFLSMKQKLNVYCENVDWFDAISVQNTVPKERQEYIKDAIFKSKSWNLESKVIIRKILRKISDVAQKHNIKLLLHGGTLLGQVRHGEIIPWDDDVDLGIAESDFTRFLELIKAETNLLFMSKVEESTNVTFYKFWDSNGVNIENYDYKFPFVDLWLYSIESTNIQFKNGLLFPNSANYQLESVDFETAIFYRAGNYLECLDSLYKDWRTKIRVYTWSHRLEAVHNYPLTLNIEVDAAGRICK